MNIHASFLPSYRDKHPINWAIINGEESTGVTLHHLNSCFDQGAIVLQKKVKSYPNDTVMNLHGRTTAKGKLLLKRFLKLASYGKPKGYPQNPSKVSYFPPRTPRDSKINWNDSAESICNLVRALTYPYPGAYFYCKRKKIVIDSAKVSRQGPENIGKGVPIFHNNNCLVKTGLHFLKINRLRNREVLEFKNLLSS